MTNKIGLVISPNVNGWFSVVSMDEAGNQQTINEGPDLGRCLTYAARVLGYPLVIPISGPTTQL